MATCLLALGSNKGDREAAIRHAWSALDADDGVRLRRRSQLIRTQPIGGPPDQDEFLNAAALIETSIAPHPLVELLRRIETQFGRWRSERWAARTLDLDLLLYDEQIIDTPALSVPHPRMSFRRFVLEPAAEIAGQMLHPTIGWTIAELLDHLNRAADRVAICSPREELRRDLAESLARRFGAQTIAPPLVGGDVLPLWPRELTTWVSLGFGRAGAAAATRPATSGHPLLTVLLDAGLPQRAADCRPSPGSRGAGPLKSSPDWPSLAARPGRGPTLRLPSTDRQVIVQEAVAAIEAARPDAISAGPKRVE